MVWWAVAGAETPYCFLSTELYIQITAGFRFANDNPLAEFHKVAQNSFHPLCLLSLRQFQEFRGRLR